MRPDGFRGTYRDDASARAVYSETAGIARILPRAVAVPADGDDVVALVRWAALAGVPLIARGSGSSMANGATGDGVIVDLSRLSAIAPADRRTGTITCGPGALRDAADAAARRAGLAFPVDPSSGRFCTVGGMASTNAAGARSLKYGAMRRWVNGLECVFADGTRAWIRRGQAPPPGIRALERFAVQVAPRLGDALFALTHDGVRKESSGYALAAYAASHDVVDLLVGSEGTLALITAVELTLVPAGHETASVLAAFESLDDAVAAAALCAGLGAAAVELLDRTFLDVVRAGTALDVPERSEAVLLIEAEAPRADLARERMAALAACCRERGAAHVVEAPDDAQQSAIWSIRHAASPILARLDPNLSSMQIVEDGAVPPSRFPDYVRGVRAVFARHGLRCVIFGHAGDAHAHVNALVDVRESAWRPRLGAVLTEVTALVASLGGTIAAEHGDGRLRAPLLQRVWSPLAIELFRATKTAFDPEGILNPGVKVAAIGQRPFEDVKYDPALPALPADARRALDAVTRERGWAQFRLGLLDAFAAERPA
ncbi:MAG: FAD-binding oxidoreductase [Gemmatimonadetes bacterium]|nr:FAD-binding oxidoreductase [Gemmatimonadota bacterium]